ncbi:unnamed protein product [Sphagnum jensenii]
MGDQKGKEAVEVLSTGSYAFDDAIGGEGGIPFGKVTQFYGPAGSGKSFFAMLAVKEAQKRDPESNQMWIDSEGTLDLRWCETLGIDTGRLLVVEGDTAVNGRLCFEMLLGVPREDAKTHALKDLHEELANLALDYDIVTKPTSMSYSYGDRKWVGAAKFNDAVRDDKELATELLAKVKTARLNKWKPKQDEVSAPETEPVIKPVPKAPKSSRSLKASPESDGAEEGAVLS